MISETLQIIVRKLNEFFSYHFKQHEEWIQLSALMDIEGKIVIQNKDIMVLTLVNIEQDRHLSMGSVKTRDEVLSLNLYVLFSAHFQSQNYFQALKMLSMVITFFHQNRAFDQHNTPDLPLEIEKLSFEIYNLELLQVSNIWSSFGGKLLPSVCYKLRSIGIPKTHINPSEIPVKQIN